MPFINVKVAGSLTVDQKRELSQKFSAALEEVAGKKPSSTYIVFEEVPREDWAVGGQLLADR